MHAFGFSTGALALGDFERALAMLAGHDVAAVELSALRDHELPQLMQRLSGLELDRFEYVSIHAPSRFENMSEAEIAELLVPCVRRGWSVVIHPNVIGDAACWEPFGRLLCIENMDKRTVGRTAAELAPTFQRLPRASFCLDLGHARQVDPSLGVARGLLRAYGSRLRQIHLSEVDTQCRHRPLSMGTVFALRALAREIAPVPVLIESQIDADEMPVELRMAHRTMQPEASLQAAP
ncbi:sugar phosphate isomerase/epimerase family protein [Haliangium sp.]|uniref:sugar phosphate isomerase/epimerase family protein n=1 Tax=Haliangium sp. TaxID=2663208 RepID=UPI003D0BB0FF